MNIISKTNKYLKDLYHNWSDGEIEILKKYYPLEGKKAFARLPYKTEEQCKRKVGKLKLVFVGNKDNKTSRYKYVCWHRQRNKWMVSFLINGKCKYFGSFDSEDEAGRVALEKAKEYGKVV